MTPIYLDYAATTPVDPHVIEAMQPFWAARFGNPSSLHHWGGEARGAVESSRRIIADALGCNTREVLLTGSATESNNLAIKGAVEAWRRQMPGRTPHIAVSPIEHHSVLETVQHLKQDGVEVRWLSVDRFGLIDPNEVEELIGSDTVLVSVGYGNNEVGTIQPIAEIGARITGRKHGNTFPLFHTDAVQAIQYTDCNVARLGVDLLSASAHKFYGPKGVGFLFVAEGSPLIRQMDGGSQESRLRAGTENVSGIVGMGKALELARGKASEEASRLEQLRDFLIWRVLEDEPRAQLTGHPTRRLPHIASFVLSGVDAEALLALLDHNGIGASSGSACTSAALEPSHVLAALGIRPETSRGSLRLSLGSGTTRKHVDYVVGILCRSVRTLVGMAPVL